MAPRVAVLALLAALPGSWAQAGTPSGTITVTVSDGAPLQTLDDAFIGVQGSHFFKLLRI